MKASRFSASQILAILKQAEDGVPVTELCREHDMRHILQMASKVWRHGHLADGANERAGEGKCTSEMDVRRCPTSPRRAARGVHKKMVKPPQRVEMAKTAVLHSGLSVRQTCKTFWDSVCCYRYERKLSSNNARIVDLLLGWYKASATGVSACASYTCETSKATAETISACIASTANWSLLHIKPHKRLKREKPEPLTVPAAMN